MIERIINYSVTLDDEALVIAYDQQRHNLQYQCDRNSFSIPLFDLRLKAVSKQLWVDISRDALVTMLKKIESMS